MCVLLAVSNVGGIATVLVTTPVLEHFGVGLGLAILPAALWLCPKRVLLLDGVRPLGAAALGVDHHGRSCSTRCCAPTCIARPSPAWWRRCRRACVPACSLVLGGIPQPLTKAIGALLLWAFAATLEHEWITGLALFLSFAVTVLSSRWGALYARTLRETLEEGSVDATMSLGRQRRPDADDRWPAPQGAAEAIDTGSPRSRELALRACGGASLEPGAEGDAGPRPPSLRAGAHRRPALAGAGTQRRARYAPQTALGRAIDLGCRARGHPGCRRGTRGDAAERGSRALALSL